jgi:hypothetical protein
MSKTNQELQEIRVDSASNGKSSATAFQTSSTQRCCSPFAQLGFLVSLSLKLQQELSTDGNSDIAFYGINLDQSIILTQIGCGKGKTLWETLQNLPVGNIIVSAAVC